MTVTNEEKNRWAFYNFFLSVFFFDRQRTTNRAKTEFKMRWIRLFSLKFFFFSFIFYRKAISVCLVLIISVFLLQGCIILDPIGSHLEQLNLSKRKQRKNRLFYDIKAIICVDLELKYEN